MSADLLERTAYTSRQVLAVAGLEWKDLQRVLLVGGSTRMPMVARMLQTLTGIQPDRTVNPDEAVARGAALYASHLLAGRTGGRGEHVSGDQRQRPQPGHGRHRDRHASQEEHRAHSAEHGPARAGTRNASPRSPMASGRSSSRSSKARALSRAMHRHRPHRRPRSARGAAQGLAGGSDVRVRRERPAWRSRRSCRARTTRRGWNWSARRGFPAKAWRAGSSRSIAAGGISTFRVGGQGRAANRRGSMRPGSKSALGEWGPAEAGGLRVPPSGGRAFVGAG